MAKTKVYDMKANEVENIKLEKNIFDIEPNMGVLHQAVVKQRANKRAGTHSTKTRSEVSGGGRKPWRQKGTGRARQGSIRSPQWVGGGVVFGPKPRDYSQKMPQKMRKLALKSAWSLKNREEELFIVNDIKFDEYKTKHMAEFLNKFRAGKSEKMIFVPKEFDKNLYRITRNIHNVKYLAADQVSVYDLLWAHKVVIMKDAVDILEEVLA
ncbi:MAG: 50S ribosomal protein L4 [Candidatus Mcinerneyibacterium aminivorans]|uniref:Large ribosomal subunit protein uL4 n=1 Tax=Candidatus Mcinerneyibacterium aminivorans TaxID=2703815 RepID=A0A5D0MIL0_9BACT|nr:MAG: 50S ribosomal protein L4 [Candidatus Mcinerneyibacterium aminivorans]